MTAYDDEVMGDSPYVYVKANDATSGGSAVDLGSGGYVWTYGNLSAGTGPIVEGDTASTPAVAADMFAEPLEGSSADGTTSLGWTVEIWFDSTSADLLIALSEVALGDSDSDFVVIVPYVANSDLSGPGRWLSLVLLDTDGQRFIPIIEMADGVHHVVFTVVEGTITAYVDGSLITATTTPVVGPIYAMAFPAAVPPVTSEILIGSTSAATGLDTAFADFAVYATALDPTRIAAHFAAGAAPSFLCLARGHSRLTAHGSRTPASHAAAQGRSTVFAQAFATPRNVTELRTVQTTYLLMPTPAVVGGIPTLPEFWAQASSSSRGTQGSKHIRAISDPNPIWDPRTSGWYTLPPATSRPFAARWSVGTLPSPTGFDNDFYWLGTPSPYDGTSNIQSACRQWDADGSTPNALPWKSVYPFKPSVIAVDHYLQGGGIVHHPKGVNFNSHFIEHMWTSVPPRAQPFTWVIAAMVASYPTPDYVHHLLDSGVSPGSKGVHYSAADCNRPRAFNDGQPGRAAIQLTHSQMLAAAHTGGKTVRTAIPGAIRPMMFVGVFDGASSVVGAIGPAFKRLTRGTLNSDAGHNYIIGRANGWLSQNRASHLLVFEIRYWETALTETELDAQYAQLGSTYQFDRYRSQ